MIWKLDLFLLQNSSWTPRTRWRRSTGSRTGRCTPSTWWSWHSSLSRVRTTASTPFLVSKKQHILKIFFSWIVMLSVADPGVYPGSEFFPSRIPIFSTPDRDPGSASKNLCILTQKMVSQLSEIWSGSRIWILIFYPSRIPYPGVKRAPDPGSGSATPFMLETAFFIRQA